VIDWFTERGWDVYQEVQIQSGYPVADIVAVMGLRVWVVECKTTLTLDLMAQAFHWQRYAHWVSVAVPETKRRGRSKG
jgi:Holliday junction resolvase